MIIGGEFSAVMLLRFKIWKIKLYLKFIVMLQKQIRFL